MSDVIKRVRDMPPMAEIERITGRGPGLYSLALRDGSVRLCTRGAYRRLFDESREEDAGESGDAARVFATIAQEQAERQSEDRQNRTIPRSSILPKTTA